MKLLATMAISSFAQNCPDLQSTAEFQSITNGGIKGTCTNSGNGSVCKVKCGPGFALNNNLWSVHTTCSCSSDTSCMWSYGSSLGSGVSNKDPQFGCCERRTQACGKARSKYHLARNLGTPYAEASDKYALMNYKIKVNTAASAGYSFLLTFPSLMPEDLALQTFARLEVGDLFRDERNGQTHVMLNSKAGFDTLAKDEKITISFGISSSGSSSAKTYVEDNNFSIKYFNKRNDCFCAGNAALCDQLAPKPTKFASFNIQVFGQTKYGKTIVKDQIVTILRRYDVSTIQEIRDSAETAFPNLVADMNSIEDIYDFHFGARQGTTSSKESVGFIWNRNKFSLVDS